MIIGIDALGAVWGGGVVYIKKILPELIKIGSHYKWIIFTNRDLQLWIMHSFPDHFGDVVHVETPNIFSRLHRFIYQQTILPIKLKNIGADVIYGPNEVVPWISPIKKIVAMRNLKIFNKEWTSTSFRLKILRLIAHISALKSSDIICPSQYMCKQVIKNFRIPKLKTHVIYHGVDDKFSYCNNKDKNRPDISPYILTVSNISPHKNYLSLIEAFKRVLKEHPGLNYRLLIVGNVIDQDYYKNLVGFIENENLRNKIMILNNIDHEDLQQIYCGANVFCMPSFIESFSLPVAEAMKSGKPLLVASTGAMKEICQNAAIYFDPSDIEDIKNSLYKILTDNDIRNKLSKNSKIRSRMFNWKKSAMELIKIMES